MNPFLSCCSVGAPFCEAEILNDQEWPKTPRDDTVINRTCEPGRTGYKMRTCAGGAWLPVHSNCVDEELAVVLDAAEVSVCNICQNICCIFWCEVTIPFCSGFLELQEGTWSYAGGGDGYIFRPCKQVQQSTQ